LQDLHVFFILITQSIHFSLPLALSVSGIDPDFVPIDYLLNGFNLRCDKSIFIFFVVLGEAQILLEQ
jgi:hypothetical protein